MILLPLVVVLLLCSILAYFFNNGQPKTVATYEQVWNAVENQGFTPSDTTDLFKDGWNDGRSKSLQKALTFQSGDKNFNFFIFDTDKAASNARASYWTYIRYESDRWAMRSQNTEYKSNSSNYTVYWIKTEKYYTVCTRVGNTVIYAEADVDANKSIIQIIEEIGYN